jgi:hypothetical protein
VSLDKKDFHGGKITLFAPPKPRRNAFGRAIDWANDKLLGFLKRRGFRLCCTCWGCGCFRTSMDSAAWCSRCGLCDCLCHGQVLPTWKCGVCDRTTFEELGCCNPHQTARCGWCGDEFDGLGVCGCTE